MVNSYAPQPTIAQQPSATVGMTKQQPMAMQSMSMKPTQPTAEQAQVDQQAEVDGLRLRGGVFDKDMAGLVDVGRKMDRDSGWT
ncbi:hypothetical protein QFC21_002144 [Naganishia friedmannii]|uniref:Uncharacterized protein n=1 Tax=Naganishia friedmannii TaxID=89922 RepID=A0ACC2VZW9_9TREE|nr:hypothetical protein QFC21_002144 [Naganishia friedmannii]